MPALRFGAEWRWSALTAQLELRLAVKVYFLYERNIGDIQWILQGIFLASLSNLRLSLNLLFTLTFSYIFVL